MGGAHHWLWHLAPCACLLAAHLERDGHDAEVELAEECGREGDLHAGHHQRHGREGEDAAPERRVAPEEVVLVVFARVDGDVPAGAPTRPGREAS